MSGKRYTDEFKSEAAKQVIEHGRPVREVAGRLGISIDSLYAWVRDQRKSPQAQQADTASSAEVRRLQAELKRVTEERDILKKAAAYFAKQSG
jgi:transposase